MNNLKFQLQVMDPNTTVEKIQEKCEFAKANGYGCIEIPQWLISCAEEKLVGSKVKISTCIGLPGGESSTFAKSAEVKQAVVNNVNEIAIPVNMLLVKQNKMDDAKNDFNEAMSLAKGKAVIKAVLEVGSLDDILLGTALHMLLELKVDVIVLSGIISGKSIEKKYVSEVKKQINQTELMILGCILSESDAEEYINLGADRVALSKG